MSQQHSHIVEKLICLLGNDAIALNEANESFCKEVSTLIGDARLVLMGESTHGTHEFYQLRMALSQYLIREKGFQAIAIEGDWTSAHSIHQYCQGKLSPHSPQQVLDTFMRFPSWMWRNELMLKFIQWLRHENDKRSDIDKVGFYGLDLYCLHEAIAEVINYLKIHDEKAAHMAIERYSCFENFDQNKKKFPYELNKQLKEACIKEVLAQFLETQHHIYHRLWEDPNLAIQDEPFYAVQNARVVKNAEHYYRAMFDLPHVTWNIRDSHMADTLQNIMSHLETKTSKPAKVIVWAHNSHIGDARATEMAERKEHNLGQLVREKFNTSHFLLGFSTAQGAVTAASSWDGPFEKKYIRRPIQGSYEWLFHQLDQKNFILNLREETALNRLLKSPQLQRAIGVIYRPETERISHYYFSRLPYQFDAIVHLDNTKPLVPLEQLSRSSNQELPDTYPEGF